MIPFGSKTEAERNTLTRQGRWLCTFGRWGHRGPEVARTASGVVGIPQHPTGSDTWCRATSNSCLLALAFPELFLAEAGLPRLLGRSPHVGLGSTSPGCYSPSSASCGVGGRGGGALSSASEDPSPSRGVSAPGEGVPGTQGARSAPRTPPLPLRAAPHSGRGKKAHRDSAASPENGLASVGPARRAGLPLEVAAAASACM